jgi:malic enzyme
VTAVRATRVTDAMMTAAAAAVSDAATIRRDPHGKLLPDRAHLADTATAVASAVAKAQSPMPSRPRSPTTRSTRPSTAPGGYPAINPDRY